MFGLALTVRADSAASSVQIYASVNADGVADVTMTVRLRVEEAVDALYFPLPSGATDIKLNDHNVNSVKGTSSIQVKLDSDMTYIGDHLLTFKFKIPDVVRMVEDTETKKNKLTLTLPLLCGFEYPVQNVSLTVMLPETIEGRPVFKSTYHQDSIDTILSYTVSNNMITGLISQQLKDHETLTMTMVVPETMFDGVSTYVRVGNPEVIPMVLCGLAALVYWLIFLRGAPLLRERRNSPPEGITAGELGVRLTLAGVDLTSTVFSWAQMGYVLIQLDDRGRVWLHKRMDMGNERSAWEIKLFRKLFQNREMADATGIRYAELSEHMAKSNPGKKVLCHPKCGNAQIFRWILCGEMLFCGICYAMNFTGIIALQVILAILLAVLGAFLGWMIQKGMYRVHLRYPVPVWISLGISVAWILLGIWAGQWIIGLCSVLVQLLGGLMAAYGGRRSELGRLNASQILGLRHYFRTADRTELKRIQENDPEYFYKMLPYAMALGVEMAFAKRFGKRKLPPCPYFTCGVKQRMTAEEWIRFFRETGSIMDAMRHRLEMEKYAVLWMR